MVETWFSLWFSGIDLNRIVGLPFLEIATLELFELVYTYCQQ